MKRISLIVMVTILVFGGVAHSDIPTDGLVAEYLFDGNANDTSGNGNDGTVNGASLTEDRFGNINSAYSFDGNDWIDVPDDSSLTLVDEFTISTWMQFGGLASYYLMGHDEGERNLNKWIFWVHDSGFLLHVNSPETGGYNPVTYDGWAPETNRWYHLVVKRSGDDFMLYLDGSLVATGEDSRPLPDPSTSFQIGTAEGGHPERVFTGLIDDVRLYNRALSESEIQELYKESNETTCYTQDDIDAAVDAAIENCRNNPEECGITGGDYEEGYSDGVQAGLAACGPPEQITLISPSGTTTNLVTFTWNECDNAEWYNIYVRNRFNREILNQWYETDGNDGFYDEYPDAECADGTCSVTMTTTLDNGTYQFYVRGWNDIDYGEWSEGMAFIINEDSPF